MQIFPAKNVYLLALDNRFAVTAFNLQK